MGIRIWRDGRMQIGLTFYASISDTLSSLLTLCGLLIIVERETSPAKGVEGHGGPAQTREYWAGKYGELGARPSASLCIHCVPSGAEGSWTL